MARCIGVFSILVLSFAIDSAKAEFFRDDFEDGSATDGIPVSWVAPGYADTGTREVIDGSFVLTAGPREVSLDTDVEGRIYRDLSLRTQFMSVAEDAVGLYMRSTLSGPLGNPSQGQQLWSFLDGRGRLSLGRLVEGDIEYLGQVNLNWDPTGQEVHMQMDLFDGILTLSAWPRSMDPPDSPQISYDLSSIGDLVSEGRVGIWTFPPQTGALGPVAFRYVEAVPEPSTLVLMVVAFGLIAQHQLQFRLSHD